jgi:hypothetical protein
MPHFHDELEEMTLYARYNKTFIQNEKGPRKIEKMVSSA